MVRIPLIGKGKKSEEEQRKEATSDTILLSEALKDEEESPLLSPELPYVLDDQRTVATTLAQVNSPFKQLLPLLAPKLSTTNLDMSQIRVFQWAVMELMTCVEIEMEEEDYNMENWCFSEALKQFLTKCINDSKLGWKMDLLSRVRKQVTLGMEKKERSWWKR